MQQPSERFARHGANGHGYQMWNNDGTDGKPWAFDKLDCYWGMAPLPLTDVSTYLWGRTRRSAEHIPITAPHGFVCIIAGPIQRQDGPWSTIWTTDGDTLSHDGSVVPLGEAREKIMKDLTTGEVSAPIHVEGVVFHQVIKESTNRYFVVLVDPGWVNPAEREAKVTIRLPGIWYVRDRLSGQELGTLNDQFSITVPAGTLRLLEIRPA